MYNIQIVQEATTVKEISWNIPKINIVIVNRQAWHQSTMIEIKGILFNEPISILIDPRGSFNYIKPHMVEKLSLKIENY